MFARRFFILSNSASGYCPLNFIILKIIVCRLCFKPVESLLVLLDCVFTCLIEPRLGQTLWRCSCFWDWLCRCINQDGSEDLHRIISLKHRCYANYATKYGTKNFQQATARRGSALLFLIIIGKRSLLHWSSCTFHWKSKNKHGSRIVKSIAVCNPEARWIYVYDLLLKIQRLLLKQIIQSSCL